MTLYSQLLQVAPVTTIIINLYDAIWVLLFAENTFIYRKFSARERHYEACSYI